MVTYVSVSSGEPVPGAGVRQQYVKHDLLAAIVARAHHAGAGAQLVVSPNPHRQTQVIVIPDDPDIPSASKSAKSKAGGKARVVRISEFLKEHRLRPLDACELSYIRARLGHTGQPCACDKSCYSKHCDRATRTCAPKSKPKAVRKQPTKKPRSGKRS